MAPSASFRQILRRLPRLYRFMRRYAVLTAGLLGMNFAQVAVISIPPMIIRYAVDDAIPAREIIPINLLFGFTVFLYLAAAGFRLANEYGRRYLGQHMGYDIRKALFDALLVQSPRFYAKRASGEITSRLNNDVRQVEYLASQAVFELTSSALQILLSIGLLFYLSWRLTVLILILTLAMFVCVTINMSHHKRLRKRISEKWGRLLGFLQENVANIKVVKAFCAEAKEATRHTRKSRDFIQDSIKAGVVQRLFWVFALVFRNLFVLGALVYGVRLIGKAEITLGVLFAFMMYIRNLFMPIFGLSGTMTTIVRAFVSVDRIYAYMEAPNEITTRPSAPSAEGLVGDLAFHDVQFRYDEAAEPALQGLSLTIRDGESVALVGPSGAGKSTVINLVLRFYDPTAGAVRFAGTDLRELDLDSWRRRIAVVFQDSLVFNDTIRDNLLYANPRAGQAELDRACRDACILDLVHELPNGYETVIGERGIKLSGGQRQRLAIARALLKDPRILLLDEATSSIDSISENRIQAALETIMQQRTTVVIAHRLTTIVGVQRICVLAGGRIVETGTHQELLARGGLYRELWTTQMEEDRQRHAAPAAT